MSTIVVEHDLLGACLLDNSTVGRVAALVAPQDFTRSTDGKLFAQMLDLYREGQPITLAGLVSIGYNRDYLAQIQSDTATAANAPYHAGLIRKAARGRRLNKQLKEMSEAAAGGEDLDKIAAQLQKAITELSDATSAETRPLGDDIVEAMRQVDEAHARGGGPVGLQTGLSDLDDKLGGIRPGQLVIIAARPAMGKSALAANIAAHVADYQDATVMIFSLEMSRLEISQRLIAAHGLIDLADLCRGRLHPDSIKLAHDAAGRVHQWASKRIIVNDSGTMTAAGVRAEVEMRKQMGPVDLVVVDYLQLMQPGHVRNRNDEVAEISRALKVLARDLKVPVIALSQLNRQVEHRDKGKPRLADLRDSGAIEQDADAVIFIYRDDEGYALNLAKNRNGPLWDLPVFFNKKSVRFDGLIRENWPGMAGQG